MKKKDELLDKKVMVGLIHKRKADYLRWLYWRAAIKAEENKKREFVDILVELLDEYSKQDPKVWERIEDTYDMIRNPYSHFGKA